MPGLTLTEFIIPLDKDELLVSRSDGYFVDEIILPAAVPQALDGILILLLFVKIPFASSRIL